MRPVVPDAVPERPRKPSWPEFSGSTESQHTAAPETFFLTRQSDDDDDSKAASQLEGNADPRGSTYGVQSLQDTINESTEPPDSPQMTGDGPAEPLSTDQTLHRDHPALRRIAAETAASKARQPDHEASSQSATTTTTSKTHPNPDAPTSLSITPLMLGSPAEPVSLPSSPKSTSTRSRPSEDVSLPDEASIHAIPSDDDMPSASQSLLQDSVPQLVMPSIKMPSRRPFTERGKGMGRLKIMLAGASGSGKTSLLKSIVQLSEDIVHVDPLPSHSSRPDNKKESRTERKPRPRSRQTNRQPSISEVYASTKPYPSWWSDLEDSRVLRRQKSVGEVVLERNLCFVDSVGGKRSRTEQTEALIQYMVQQLSRALGAIQGANSDMQGLLAGNGGAQVDVILYLISEVSQETISADIECIRRLAQFSNVIPLISKADARSPEEIRTLKQSFVDKLVAAGSQPFTFGGSSPENDGSTRPHAPFAVSSANSTDDETMDASTLMSADYVQPLVPSELTFVVDSLFDRDNVAWLRHSAAKKLIQSQHLRPQAGSGSDTLSRSMADPQSNSGTTFSSRVPSRNRAQPSINMNPSSYTLARVTDQAQREEHLAQVRLTKWATDLQRSMQNERRRYESLARNERAVWLTERLGECVVDGSLVPLTETPGFGSFHGRGHGSVSPSPGDRIVAFPAKDGSGRRMAYRVANSRSSPHDPLGILGWNDELKRRGWLLVQVVSSVGVVGGLALWVARVWGLSSSSPNSSEWTLAWLGGGS